MDNTKRPNLFGFVFIILFGAAVITFVVDYLSHHNESKQNPKKIEWLGMKM